MRRYEIARWNGSIRGAGRAGARGGVAGLALERRELRRRDAGADGAAGLARAAHDREVHAVGPGAEHTTQTRGAELEAAREAIADLGPALGVEEGAQLGAVVGAGIVGEPGFGTRTQRRHIDHARIEACARPD